MKVAETQKKAESGLGIRYGAVEGVILVNGKPQVERADMPLTLSFNSIEELERFCKDAKSRNRGQI